MRRYNSSKGTIGTCSCFEFSPIGANIAVCLTAFEMVDTKDPLIMKAELTSHSHAERKSCWYQLPRSENQSVRGSPLPKVLTEDTCQIQLWARAHRTRESCKALTQSWTESLAEPAGQNPSPGNCLTSEQLRAETFIPAATRLKWRPLWMRFFLKSLLSGL